MILRGAVMRSKIHKFIAILSFVFLVQTLLNTNKAFSFAVSPNNCGTMCYSNMMMYQPMFSPFMGTPFYPSYMYQPMVGQMNYYNPVNTWSGNWYPTYNQQYYSYPGYYPGSYYGGMTGYGVGLSY